MDRRSVLLAFKKQQNISLTESLADTLAALAREDNGAGRRRGAKEHSDVELALCGSFLAVLSPDFLARTTDDLALPTLAREMATAIRLSV